uniref:Uncharacterized protein n=1 Tax=Melanopsichium pennsylvanicum 4 TaxID=1398559 RepID=A0A077R8P0_9BASI|nr:uncharacterized protein BN887_00151 [Melanopsichium pennsylvanicum 4]
MAARNRVKLDLGPHGKVLASVLDFDDARTVAAGRFDVAPSGVQLYVSDGEDLWELHPSAFQDVVAENGVIVAKTISLPSSSTPQQAAAIASTLTAVSAVTKTDPPRSQPSSTASTTSASQQAGLSTATSAPVRTVIGPNGLPVSSKERWDPKTHRLMFEKLNEIISSETIYYTRKYTEERYRIFQLLIANYGDMGIKGNFLRGRTAQALISRVAGVLRTANERGEKIKQPFKFFFPNRKDDDLATRSATLPAPLAAVASTSRAALQANGNRTWAQTQPAQAREAGRGRGRSRASTAASQASQATSATMTQTIAQIASDTSDNGQHDGQGKGKGEQQAQNAANGQNNPPEIRKRSAAAAANPLTTSPARPGKRQRANGKVTATHSQPKKQTQPPKKQPQPKSAPNRVHAQNQRDASADRLSRTGPSARERSRCRGVTSHRNRSASPRPANHRDDDDERYDHRSREEILGDVRGMSKQHTTLIDGRITTDARQSNHQCRSLADRAAQQIFWIISNATLRVCRLVHKDVVKARTGTRPLGRYSEPIPDLLLLSHR